MGRTQADGRHGYLGGLLTSSLTVLAVLCAIVLLRALFGPARVQAPAVRLYSLWTRLAVAQIALYTIAERAEGYVPPVSAYFAEVFVALLVAIALLGFSRLLSRCQQAASEYSEYLRRAFARPYGFWLPVHCSAAHALSVSAGTARFSRPPPRSMS